MPKKIKKGKVCQKEDRQSPRKGFVTPNDPLSKGLQMPPCNTTYTHYKHFQEK